MTFLTPEMVGGIVRSVLAAGGGFAIAKGWIAAEDWQTISGAALTFAVAAWSVWSKRV